MKRNLLVRGLVRAATNSLLCRQGWMPIGAAFLLFSSSSTLLAQASSGITGTITDPSGAVIPNAAVVITNTATGTVNNVTSSSSGTYAVTGLIPGLYKIEVTAEGFTKAIRTSVNVEVTVTDTIDIQLTSGSSNETVEVTANLISLNTTLPELGTTIEPEVVASLPVAIGGGRGRQIDNLQFLAPGVTGDTFSHNVNGGVNFEQEILYNGIPAPQAETAGLSGNFNPPFELVSQFRLERSTFSAKYGLAQGAVTYQTVSGTNNYHGDAFYIGRNEYFDARGYFNPTTPRDRENNYGFTIGGPVSIPHLYNGKDRTFFTFALDFAKLNNSFTGIGTVPTALEKTGDFSDFIDPNTRKVIPIFDPTTGLPFPGNIIPQSRFSAASSSVLQYLPDPDRGGLVNNKNYIPNAFPIVNHVIGFTIDHNLTSKQSLHYAQWRNTLSQTVATRTFIYPTTNPLQSTESEPRLGSVYLLNYVNTITPSLVATAGVSWIGEINNELNNNLGQTFAGVTPRAGGATFNAFPVVNFDGQNALTSWGNGSDGGETLSNNRKLGISAVTNFLWIKGRHTFNIGGEMRRAYQDDNECRICSGTLNFSQKTTADPNNIGSTGSSFASFLLGQVDSAQRVFANELRLRNLLIAPYVQDDIKITPKFTLNVGMRWDIMLPFTERDNQIIFLNPGQPNSAIGGYPGTGQRFSNAAGGVNRADIVFKNFGPRIGFAYAINDKTVFQAGYNISYLNGGAYEFGTSKVATTYGNLLQGSFQASTLGGTTTTPGYGSYDERPLPAPVAQVGPQIGFGTQIEAFDPKRDGAPPYLQQWNFNLQRQLPWNTFLQVAYVGNHAIHLPSQLNAPSQGNPDVLLPLGSLLTENINSPRAVAAGIQSPFPGFNGTVARALSPFPQYNQVFDNFDLAGAATYNGLQTSLEKRFSNGLSFLTSYTLSRTLANNETAFATFSGLPVNKYNQYPEYTVSGADVKNNAAISGTYELPLGPGKRFVNNRGIAGQIVGGIQVGWIARYLTGTPFGVGVNGVNNPLGCNGCGNRPNQVPGVAISSTNYSNLGFDTEGASSGHSTRRVFTTNAFTTTTGQFVLGNALRQYSQLRQPGFYQEDVKASKKFALGEHVNLTLEMNYFNILNRTRFNGPNTNVDDASNYGFVGAGQQNSPRQGQISGRISF